MDSFRYNNPNRRDAAFAGLNFVTANLMQHNDCHPMASPQLTAQNNASAMVNTSAIVNTASHHHRRPSRGSNHLRSNDVTASLQPYLVETSTAVQQSFPNINLVPSSQTYSSVMWKHNSNQKGNGPSGQATRAIRGRPSKAQSQVDTGWNQYQPGPSQTNTGLLISGGVVEDVSQTNIGHPPYLPIESTFAPEDLAKFVALLNNPALTITPVGLGQIPSVGTRHRPPIASTERHTSAKPRPNPSNALNPSSNDRAIPERLPQSLSNLQQYLVSNVEHTAKTTCPTTQAIPQTENFVLPKEQKQIPKRTRNDCPNQRASVDKSGHQMDKQGTAPDSCSFPPTMPSNQPESHSIQISSKIEQVRQSQSLVLDPDNSNNNLISAHLLRHIADHKDSSNQSKANQHSSLAPSPPPPSLSYDPKLSPDKLFIDRPKRIMSKIDTMIEKRKRRRFERISSQPVYSCNRGGPHGDVISSSAHNQAIENGSDLYESENEISSDDEVDYEKHLILENPLPLREPLNLQKYNFISGLGLLTKREFNNLQLEKWSLATKLEYMKLLGLEVR